MPVGQAVIPAGSGTLRLRPVAAGSIAVAAPYRSSCDRTWGTGRSAATGSALMLVRLTGPDTPPGPGRQARAVDLM
jgi:hypothetical protein